MDQDVGRQLGLEEGVSSSHFETLILCRALAEFDRMSIVQNCNCQLEYFTQLVHIPATIESSDAQKRPNRASRGDAV